MGAFLLRARREGLRDFGACMSPHTAWLILQGIETLPLRMERHMSNTEKVVQFLASQPFVGARRPPHAGEPPQPRSWRKSCCRAARARYSALTSRARASRARSSSRALKVFSHLANVGDCRSLVIHPASTTHFRLSDDALASGGHHAGHDPPVHRAGRRRRPDRRPQARSQGRRKGRSLSHGTARQRTPNLSATPAASPSTRPNLPSC